MAFWCGVYKTLGSPISTNSFSDMILSRFIKHYSVSSLPTCVGVWVVERGGMLQSQVEGIAFRSHIKKYGLLMWGLYSSRLFNLNSSYHKQTNLKHTWSLNMQIQNSSKCIDALYQLMAHSWANKKVTISLTGHSSKNFSAGFPDSMSWWGWHRGEDLEAIINALTSCMLEAEKSNYTH